MSSNILARADALMQRRRLSGNEADDVPLLIDAIDPDSDIPVLLDAEPAAEEQEAPAAGPQAAGDSAGSGLGDDMLDFVTHELARRVHERLAAELPAIVESTVRDFLAEPEIRALLHPRG